MHPDAQPDTAAATHTAPALAPLAPARVIWLLTRLRLVRLLNQSRKMGQRVGGGAARRQASAGKKRGEGLLGIGIGALMLFGFFHISVLSLENLHCHLDLLAACGTMDSGDTARMADAMMAQPFSTTLITGVTLMLTLLMLVAAMLPLAGRELAQQDWDLEWLVTLPLSRRLLLLARVCERSLSNPYGLVGMFPLCTVIAWDAGARFSAPLLGIFFMLPLLLLSALLWTLVDTGLRLSLGPARLRNLQALMSMLSMPLMLLAMSFGTAANFQVTFQFDMARALPEWIIWTPPGLVVQALNASGPAAALGLTGMLLIEVALIMLAGLALLAYQLRMGVVGSGGRESGRQAKPAKAVTAAFTSDPGTPARSSFLSPVQRRELTLLGRDRNFLVQSLVLPVVILLSQLAFQGRLSSLAGLGANPAVMAAIAFALGTHVLMLSAMQTLNREGGALWLLYTFPQTLSQVLRQKAQLWAVLALAYPLAVFATGAVLSHNVSWETLRLLMLVLVGLPIYAYLAVAIGVFASDPLAQSQGEQSPLRPTYVYLYLLLSGLYVYGMFASHWWESLVLLVLLTALAFAFWQKASDRLPYLLDPEIAPPARVTLADGLIAAMLYFVIQGVALMLFRVDQDGLGSAGLTLAFLVAGAVVYLLVRFIYWRTKTQGVPAIIGGAMRPALVVGLAGGAAMALFGLAYVTLLRHADLGHGTLPLMTATLAQRWWLVLAAVVAAPLCEEFLFRGLIYGGLRRSMPPWTAALASAAIFAIVHPPTAMLPVFVLGLATAWVYERTKSLLAPMLVHALYNAAVAGLQLFT